MQLLKQSSDNCLLYAAAMVLEVTPEQLIQSIGHDGEEVWWPEQIGSQKKRSFHIQEILDAARSLNYSFICIDAIPLIGIDDFNIKEIYPEPMLRLASWIKDHPGILIVDSGGIGHAVAWDGEQVFDPKGFIKSVEDYIIESAYLLIKLI